MAEVEDELERTELLFKKNGGIGSSFRGRRKGRGKAWNHGKRQRHQGVAEGVSFFSLSFNLSHVSFLLSFSPPPSLLSVKKRGEII